MLSGAYSVTRRYPVMFSGNMHLTVVAFSLACLVGLALTYRGFRWRSEERSKIRKTSQRLLGIL